MEAAAPPPKRDEEGPQLSVQQGEPPMKKLKRNQTAFMFFCHANRDKLREENPGMQMAEQSRVLSSMWKATSEAERDKYQKMANEDKERYQREVAEQVALGFSPAEAKAGERRELSPYETVIPLGRVKRTCKLDPDVKNITKEATALIAKATEFFLVSMAEESFKISSLSGRRTLKPEDIRDCVNRLPHFEWLRDDFPNESSEVQGLSSGPQENSASVASTSNPITAYYKPVSAQSHQEENKDAETQGNEATE